MSGGFAMEASVADLVIDNVEAFCVPMRFAVITPTGVEASENFYS